MTDAVILGALQGIAEWLPISSEGVTAAFYAMFRNDQSGETARHALWLHAVHYALWLHMGTAASALIAFRRTALRLAQDVVGSPRKQPNLLRYLAASTLASALVGLPLLWILKSLPPGVGAAGMGAVGLLMLITGGVQLRRPSHNKTRAKGIEDVSTADALIAGVAQGAALLPGLSRSGLTVAALIARRVDRKEALRLSFLMSIPVSLAAGIYAGISGGLFTDGSALLAIGIAALVGLLTIKALLRLAERVNFAAFALILGAAILAGALWQALG